MLKRYSPYPTEHGNVAGQTLTNRGRLVFRGILLGGLISTVVSDIFGTLTILMLSRSNYCWIPTGTAYGFWWILTLVGGTFLNVWGFTSWKRGLLVAAIALAHVVFCVAGSELAKTPWDMVAPVVMLFHVWSFMGGVALAIVMVRFLVYLIGLVIKDHKLKRVERQQAGSDGSD